MGTLIKPNWDNFKAKFSENPQDNFEWFCYLLFSKEYNKPYGTHRYKNQSGIETDPIDVGDKVIGWQSKFYGDSLSNHKDDLIGTLTKTKRDNPTITKIILYTNSEWGQGQGDKEPKAKTDTEEKAKELGIDLVWRVRSYFESSFVVQVQRDISRYFFELDSKWEFSEYGFRDILKERYLNDFKTINLLLNNTPKPIDEIFVNLAIIKEKKEEQTKEYKREALLSSYEEIHKPKEPIEIKELIDTSKKSLIYGKAGVGKTTLCKYIAYMWANEKLYSEFEYMIYISLREWKTKGLKGAIKDNYYSQDDKDITLDIKENAQKILFLFDGYDELDNDKKELLKDEIKKYNLTHYIITSRPYGYQRNDFRVDEHFETIGFTDENIEDYINNFFDHAEKKESLKKFLENNIGIKHIAYIPLMLEMICSLWVEESFSDSLTMTELYGQVVEYVLQKQNKHNKQVSKPINREKIQKNLGKIALEGLKEQQIVFDFKFINQIFSEDEMNFFENNAIPSGFIKSDRSEEDILDTKLEFPHLTFQEYFSALYVASLSKEEQSKIIRDWKFYPHMQMFFAFLGGLIEDKEFLLGEIESEPRDLVGFYELFLIIDCLNEIKNYDNKLYINKTLQLLKYSMEQENLYENLFKPILHKIQNYKYFHTEQVYEAIYNIILESSNPPSFPFHNLIVTMIENLAYILPAIIDSSDEIIKKYSKIVQDEKLSMYIKNIMAIGFSLLINNTINKKLIETIKKENIDINYRFWMCKALIYSNSNDIEKVDAISTFLEKNIEKIDNNIFYLLFNTSYAYILEKEKLIKNLDNILNKYSNSNSFNLVELTTDISNLKSSLENRTYQRESRFQVYNLSKLEACWLIRQENTKEKYSEEEYIDDLIYIASNSSFDTYMDRRAAFVTLESLGRVDDKILNLAIDYLDSEEHDLKGEANKLFFSINRDDDNYINILKNAFNNNEDNKITIAKKLFTLNRKDTKYINILKSLNFLVPEIFHKSILSKSIEGFEEIFTDESIDLFFKEKCLNTNLDINILFQAYDKKYNITKFLLSNLIYSNMPLYIKNNKLHTIENGKEISTKREIDEKTLPEIQTLISLTRTHP